MRLENEHGIAVDLRLVGYHFPAIYPPNVKDWVVIAGEITHPKGDWDFQSLVSDGEAMRLGNWLGQLPAAGKWRSWAAIVANLHFKLKRSAGRPILQIGFGYESGPPWLPYGEWIYLDFPLAKAGMKETLRSWGENVRSQLFPAGDRTEDLVPDWEGLEPREGDEGDWKRPFLDWWSDQYAYRNTIRARKGIAALKWLEWVFLGATPDSPLVQFCVVD